MNNFFSINQVGQSCGVSRSTLLRLEERGLLTPARVDQETGYRWYDNHNVSQVMQILSFLHMGLTYDDAALYYRANGTSQELLERIEERFLLLKRAYEEIKLRVEKKDHLSFSFVDLPEYVCFCREYQGTTVEDRYWAMYNLYHEAVEKGYRLLKSEPLFIINKRTDYLDSAFEDKEMDFICCVPLEPDEPPEEAVTIPACRGFSCLGYGGYSHRTYAFNEFGREIRERGLKPTGYVRVLGLVAAYTGRDIDPENYVSRLVVPVEG